MSPKEHTFVFADLAGFTALTEAHGDERAADVALEFCAEINRRLPDDAEDLKMLGDACLLRVGSAADAVRVGLELTRDLARRHGFPDVRVGMHTGSAARRGGDWFGSAINIAARVSSQAGPGDVVLTAATLEAADATSDVRFEDLGAHQLRHVTAPVFLYRASLAEAEDDAQWVVDPVCQMHVNVEQATTRLDYEGTQHYFCSSICAGAFSRSPEHYAREARRPR